MTVTKSDIIVANKRCNDLVVANSGHDLDGQIRAHRTYCTGYLGFTHEALDLAAMIVQGTVVNHFAKRRCSCPNCIGSLVTGGIMLGATAVSESGER